MKLEEEWYALIIPNGHIEFWKYEDKDFHTNVSWEENEKAEFKATLPTTKDYIKRYNLKCLFENEELESYFNN